MQLVLRSTVPKNRFERKVKRTEKYALVEPEANGKYSNNTSLLLQLTASIVCKKNSVIVSFCSLLECHTYRFFACYIQCTAFPYSMLTQHIRESLQVTPGPFPDYLGGAWII